MSKARRLRQTLWPTCPSSLMRTCHAGTIGPSPQTLDFGKLFLARSLTALPRALTAADLDLEGALTACKGSISYDGKTILMNVDYIEGSIKNGQNVMNELIEKATKMGAQELRIQATIANEGFYATLRRFDFTHQPGANGYTDQFVRPTPVNQIPR